MENAIAIAYGTWHGQAEKVARRIADVFYMYGVQATLLNVRGVTADRIAIEPYDAVIAVGAVHFGHHPRALVDFVRRKMAALSTIPTAFVSVSGAAAALHGKEEAERYIHEFIVQTGWQPGMTLSVAGGIPYTRYDAITRLIMKFASRISGRDSDTSRDYEYTNWFAVEDFARKFLAELGIDQRRGTAATQ